MALPCPHKVCSVLSTPLAQRGDIKGLTMVREVPIAFVLITAYAADKISILNCSAPKGQGGCYRVPDCKELLYIKLFDVVHLVKVAKTSHPCKVFHHLHQYLHCRLSNMPL